MDRRSRLSLAAWVLALATSVSAGAQAPLPIFDAHLHYNDEAAAAFPVAEVMRIFRANGVTALLATSRPNDGTRALVAAAQDAQGRHPASCRSSDPIARMRTDRPGSTIPQSTR